MSLNEQMNVEAVPKVYYLRLLFLMTFIKYHNSLNFCFYILAPNNVLDGIYCADIIGSELIERLLSVAMLQFDLQGAGFHA